MSPALLATAGSGSVEPACALALTVLDVGHQCGGRIGSFTVDDITASGAMVAILARTSPDMELHLQGTGNARYRYIGGLIYDLKRRGLKRVGFISEPPPSHGPE